MREHAEGQGFTNGRSKLACICHLLKAKQILREACYLCDLCVSSASASGREIFFFVAPNFRAFVINLCLFGFSSLALSYEL